MTLVMALGVLGVAPARPQVPLMPFDHQMRRKEIDGRSTSRRNKKPAGECRSYDARFGEYNIYYIFHTMRIYGVNILTRVPSERNGREIRCGSGVSGRHR